MLQFPVTDIQSFVYLLGWATGLMSILGNVYTVWAYHSCGSLKGIFDSDIELGLTSSEEDFILLPILFSFVPHILAFFRLLTVPSSMRALDTFMSSYTCRRMSVIKHLITKRVKAGVANLTARYDILNEFLSVRRVLDYNRKVNNAFTLRVTLGLTEGLTTFLLSVSAFWRVYGLKNIYDCFEFRSPVGTVLFTGHVMFDLIFMSTSMMRLENILEVAILELAHTPVQFTALDFISVNNALIIDEMAVEAFHTTPSSTMCCYRDRMDTSSSGCLVWFYIDIADSNFAIPVGNGCGSISLNSVIHNVLLQRQDGYQLERGMAVAAFHSTPSSTMCCYRDRMDTSSSGCLVWFYIDIADTFHSTPSSTMCCYRDRMDTSSSGCLVWFYIDIADSNFAIPVGNGCGSISLNSVIHNVLLQRQDGYQLERVPGLVLY
ncbi:hypothetical protein J6590_096833 [Homalodisca vitripennis]|nr:hypothetical protein J6590_096833 [Homalodisca vitripennis]